MRKSAVWAGGAEQARLEGGRVVPHRPGAGRQRRRLRLASMSVPVPIDTATAGILPTSPAPSCDWSMRGVIRRRRTSIALAKARERSIVERGVGREMLDLRIVPVRVRWLVSWLCWRQVGRKRVAVRVGGEVWMRFGICAGRWCGM